MNEELLRKLAGIPIQEDSVDPQLAKDKANYFQKLIEGIWGVKTKMNHETRDRYKVTCYSPKNIEIGYTTIDIGGRFGDILFGTASGLFLSDGSKKAMESARATFKSYFKGK